MNAPTLYGNGKWYEQTGGSPSVPTVPDEERVLDGLKAQAFRNVSAMRNSKKVVA